MPVSTWLTDHKINTFKKKSCILSYDLKELPFPRYQPVHAAWLALTVCLISGASKHAALFPFPYIKIDWSINTNNGRQPPWLDCPRCMSEHFSVLQCSGWVTSFHENTVSSREHSLNSLLDCHANTPPVPQNCHDISLLCLAVLRKSFWREDCAKACLHQTINSLNAAPLVIWSSQGLRDTFCSKINGLPEICGGSEICPSRIQSKAEGKGGGTGVVVWCWVGLGWRSRKKQNTLHISE